jgi:hypothetical protein
MQTSACAQDGPQRVYADTNMTTLANNSPRDCIAYCAVSVFHRRGRVQELMVNFQSGAYTLAGVEYGDEVGLRLFLRKKPSLNSCAVLLWYDLQAKHDARHDRRVKLLVCVPGRVGRDVRRQLRHSALRRNLSVIPL